MSKAKFAATKELIKEKHYDEARGILRTIDHPTAVKWLQRVDELDPPFPSVHGRQAPNAPQTVMQTDYPRQASVHVPTAQDKY